jgi:cysteine-rich repeat protein
LRAPSLFLALLVVGCPLPPPAACGDGALNAGEACDDGNNLDADGCEADCSLPACQNGIIDPGEVCLFGPVDVAAGLGSAGLVAADFDADGALDLATAAAADESLSLLLGDGAGSFSRGADVPLLGSPSPLVSGDFDGDGALDLATSLITGPPSSPVVRGDGNGVFSPLVALTLPSPAASLIAGDFDGDGALDLVTGDSGGDGVALFLNSGRAGFLVPGFFAPGVRVSSLVAGDFDGDGALDLAVAQALDAGLLVLLGDGAGSFTEQPSQAFGVSSLAAADFDGDGALDLVSSSSLERSVSVLLNNGVGLFAAVQSFPFLAVASFAVVDLDGDGALDFVASGAPDVNDRLPAVVPFLGDGAGGFSPLPRLLLGGLAESTPDGLVAADFNGDDLLDLASTDQTGERVQVFFSAP